MPTNRQPDRIVAPKGSTFNDQKWLINFADLCYLGGHEFGSATKCTCGIAKPHVFLAQAIISDLDVTVQCQENVVQLQISVPRINTANTLVRDTAHAPIDDTVRMEILESKQYL